MLMREGRQGKDGDRRFVELPWDEQTPQWQAIDLSLPADHLVRQIAEAVDSLDLAELFTTYAGRGSKALWPDLLLKSVLYEMQRGCRSPAQWYRDAKENDPLKWLLRGMTPARATWYEFRARVAEFWDAWNEQVLRKAEALEISVGERVALDGSLIAALASRHRLVNQQTLTARTEQLEGAVAADQQGSAVESAPGWMAKHPETREDQLARYRKTQARMDQLQAENAKRKSSKRKKPGKVVVSVSEPETVLGRDKLKVFRPLYNVQLMYDVDWGFITAYQTFAQQNDPGTIGPMLERSLELTGKKPGSVLADAAYAGGPDLAVCEQAGVTLYAPVSENDFSEAKGKKRKPAQIPKKEFSWLPDEQTYRCPEGHLLNPGKTTVLERSNDRAVRQTAYRCVAEHCLACPRKEACTPAPAKGRSVSRLEHEDLVDELRARMQTPEAKQLYKLRRQTIELRYADLKEHRQLRRFSGYGLSHARAEIAASVLAYNLLLLPGITRASPAIRPETTEIPEEVPS